MARPREHPWCWDLEAKLLTSRHHHPQELQQPALAAFHPDEYLPGPGVGDDDAALAKAAGDIGTTIFHPVGTAKMGLPSDPMAVVDERLRFFGLERLRVVDASVMPTITSGNTNTPTAMIAENDNALGRIVDAIMEEAVGGAPAEGALVALDVIAELEARERAGVVLEGEQVEVVALEPASGRTGPVLFGAPDLAQHGREAYTPGERFSALAAADVP